jgi:hypothetical protein
MHERIFNESCVSDIVLGEAPATLGRYDRQPYWLTEALVSWSMHKRIALAGTCRWPSALQPQLQPHQLHPDILKAASLLLQLSFHRYSTVALRAARSLALFPACICTGLTELMLPAMTAAAAVLVQGEEDVGLPNSDMCAEGGFLIPLSSVESSAQLQRQQRRLSELVKKADGDAGVSIDAAVTGSVEKAADGVCTSDNKHILLGGLLLLTEMRSSVSAFVHTGTSPLALTVLYMAAITTQRYILPVCPDAVPILVLQGEASTMLRMSDQHSDHHCAWSIADFYALS